MELPWLSNPGLQRKQRFSATDMLDSTCTSETTDRRTDTRIDVENITPRHVAGYEFCISETHSSGGTQT